METLGIVHGKQIELEDVIPGLEGKRVRVRLEPFEAEKVMSPSEQTQVWRRWVDSGPQGPIEDDPEGWP